ncbi:MAG: metalloregulator ArsR/SmtB family transcription factor [Candidatus Acidiferrales bacterium]
MKRQQIEKISKALADETRLRIFETISSQPKMICGDIVSLRGVTPATVSHHLKILQDAGLIECRKNGQFVHSQAVPETIAKYAEALSKMVTPTMPEKRSRKLQR